MENRIRDARWLNTETGGKLQIEGSAVLVSDLPKEFLPVIDVRFDGELRVQPAVTEPDASDTIRLVAADAEKFFNSNGEGYYDPPTLRSEQWHFAVRRAGKYKIEVEYKPGPYSRVIDIEVDGKLIKANLYGKEQQLSNAGDVELQPARNLSLKIAPGSPASRGAKLDLEITRISLVLQ
jgi:hypothetical protein